jgi:hypothetical protein
MLMISGMVVSEGRSIGLRECSIFNSKPHEGIPETSLRNGFCALFLPWFTVLFAGSDVGMLKKNATELRANRCDSNRYHQLLQEVSGLQAKNARLPFSQIRRNEPTKSIFYLITTMI